MKFPHLKKEIPIKMQQDYRRSNAQNQKRNFLFHIIRKTLSVQKNERILKAGRE